MRRQSNATQNTSPTLNIDHAVTDIRYPNKRKSIIPAGLAAEAKVKEAPPVKYFYDPHLPPVLRFDPTGNADELPELLQTAAERKLTADEIQLLADALRKQEPSLEWAGKRERKECEVDPVALQIHERVSAQAVVRLAARQDIAPNLFADPQQQYHEAIQFYQHDVQWANRLILGDSLQVMASLSQREDLAGKVQMIYMDPPYGIKFGSNFQSQVGKRDVKDGKDEDLTREPEVVKAYRDTWELGVHSYLTYLRDRLRSAKELLTDSGSIFVQISDENLHRVRLLMDEVFGSENFISQISFSKTSGLGSSFLYCANDFLLWYSKDKNIVKYSQLYRNKADYGVKGYDLVELATGETRRLTSEEKSTSAPIPPSARIFTAGDATSQGNTPSNFHYCGRDFVGGWKTNVEPGMRRLAAGGRLYVAGNTLRYVRALIDFDVSPLNSHWEDTGIAGFASDKMYVVQTLPKVIERCILMTTDPGDLVLDPTCGSGTTAYVAEQWGRRWVTIDSSRVSLAIARQRLLTSKFDYYKMRPVTADDTSRNPNGLWLRDPQEQISGPCTFECKTVPHITLKSIAQNQALDPIFAHWEAVLSEKLAYLNLALDEVTPELRNALKLKLAAKEKKEGKKAITDADRRRWLLPTGEWKEWEVPFDIDHDWPTTLQEALTEYRKVWRQKMDEVNRAIDARAEQEELVDQPDVHRGILRVSGPFTVEGVKPAEQSLELGGDALADESEPLDTFAADSSATVEVPTETVNAGAYLDRMISLLRADEVRFPNNKTVKFSHLSPLNDDTLHAEGTWETGGEEHHVAVVFGPQYGPVTVPMVVDALHRAGRRGYDDLLIAGFSFDAMAQATIDEDPNPRVRCHMSHIRPDVNPAMNGLLKKTQSSQLFTVSGLPRVELTNAPNGEHIVVMEGVDIYDPIGNTVQSAGADKVAAWFVDSDYNGETFCICQAFFPDPKAWEKIANDIRVKGLIDPAQFATFSGTRSLPFPTGSHKRVAVKVIDPRGNEVMRVLHIGEVQYV